MQDEDSSSVNVSVIAEDGIPSSGSLIKLTFSNGETGYTRLYYTAGKELQNIGGSCRLVLNETETEIIFAAIRCYEAECTALKYLTRAEHSKKGLFTKLIKKGFSKEECSAALSYLSSKNYLDDKRFAQAWLSVRILCKAEGRCKLLSELCARGIDFELAETVVNEMISVETEKQLCGKALCAQRRKGFSEEKLTAAMQRLGFPLKLIKECKAEY